MEVKKSLDEVLVLFELRETYRGLFVLKTFFLFFWGAWTVQCYILLRYEFSLKAVFQGFLAQIYSIWFVIGIRDTSAWLKGHRF